MCHVVRRRRPHSLIPSLVLAPLGGASPTRRAASRKFRAGPEPRRITRTTVANDGRTRGKLRMPRRGRARVASLTCPRRAREAIHAMTLRHPSSRTTQVASSSGGGASRCPGTAWPRRSRRSTRSPRCRSRAIASWRSSPPRSPRRPTWSPPIESDIALTIRVMREANRDNGRIDSVVEGRRRRSPPRRSRRLAERVPTFDFFGGPPDRDRGPEQLRLHAIATQRAADRLAREVALQAPRPAHGRRRCCTTSASSSSPTRTPATPTTSPATRARPRSACARERRELVVDHALVGGALARRWGLPDAIATGDRAPPLRRRARRRGVRAPRRHARALRAGRPRRAGVAAAHGRRRRTRLRRSCARSCAICPTRTPTARAPSTSARSQTASCRCSSTSPPGSSYNKIADELELLTSTVRTHLTSIYRKLDAVDRAQAVLIATRRGWLTPR